MFLGEFTHNLDSKGRLTLPAKYREQLNIPVARLRKELKAHGADAMVVLTEWNVFRGLDLERVHVATLPVDLGHAHRLAELERPNREGGRVDLAGR